MLYQSDIRWTSITTGREPDISNGLSIRFVPRREAASSEPDTLALQIEQVPEDEPGIAARLFGAVGTDQLQSTIPPGGWRSILRTSTAGATEAQAEPWAGPAKVGSAVAVDEGGSPVNGGAPNRLNEAIPDDVTLVRLPLMRAPQEPGSTAERSEAVQERASSEDIVVTWDEPALANATQAASSEGQGQRSATKDAEGIGSRSAISDSRSDVFPSNALQSNLGRATQEELPAGLRPRRGWVWAVVLGSAAGLIAAGVSAGRIMGGEPEVPVVVEGPSAGAGVVPPGFSITPRHNAVLDMKSAADGAKEGAGAGEIPGSEGSPSTNSSQGNHATADKPPPKTGKQSSRTRPTRPDRVFGGETPTW
jgi:hypothetical protein